MREKNPLNNCPGKTRQKHDGDFVKITVSIPSKLAISVWKKANDSRESTSKFIASVLEEAIK